MKKLSFKEAYGKAYHDFKPQSNELDNFIHALDKFKIETDETESEEHNVKAIIDFLKQTAYGDDKYKVNPYRSVDIAILEDGIPKVLIDVKRVVGNKTEMVTTEDLNKKAFHESLLYYMQEINPPKNKERNNAIGHIIITNGREWFIMNTAEINKILEHHEIKKAYQEIIRDKNWSNTTTEAFYAVVQHIIAKYKLLEDTKVVYIDFEKDYSREELQDINKLFIPRYLLKNDGTNLN